MFSYHANTGLTVDIRMPAGAESFDRMETMDETKPDNNDPHCENGAANHVGEEDAHGEAAAAGEEIERLAPLPIPVSTRPTLNSLTSGSVPMTQCHGLFF